MPDPKFVKRDSGTQNNHSGTGAQINNENGAQYNATTMNFGHLNKDKEKWHHILRILPSTIDMLSVDQFLEMLSVVNQDKHQDKIPPLSLNDPSFYWVFKNVDFVKWNREISPQVLWLSGPPDRNIEHVASYIVHERKKLDSLLLYFFCRAVIWETRIENKFVHTLLYQIIRRSPEEKGIIIMRHFLHTLFEAYQQAPDSSWKMWGINETESADEGIRKLLDAPATCLFDALRSILAGEENESLLVIDGWDTFNLEGRTFVNRVLLLVDNLQQNVPKVKILLTGRSMGKFKLISRGLSSIHYDKERQECLRGLRFEDQRSAKISEEYQDTCEWLWEHQEYRKWSTSQSSHLLLIQGKPGSGKSTITKYFHNNLLQRERNASRAIVAKFFYSYREGQLHRSHYQLLRSILYDILDQDDSFFYHKCQSKYRELHNRRAYWDRTSLTEVIESLYDHASAKQLYIIIDAVDESEDDGRQEVLHLLFRLCDERKNTITRVFIASRPVDGPWLERQRECQSVITLQNETKLEIEKFANSFLMELYLTDILNDALSYIIKHAEGVFLWVKLVGRELARYSRLGHSQEDIFKFLQSLPTELEDFYTHMFEKMMENQLHLGNAVKMLRFVLFSKRPLTVGELLHSIAMPDDPHMPGRLTDSFLKRIPSRELIHSCGGNFLEIKSDHGLETVQIMHQTVGDFFRRSNGCVANSKFRMCESEANISISITCIRYLMLCVENTALAPRPADRNDRSRTHQCISSFAKSFIPRKPPDITYWIPKTIEDYAKYLDERPLAHYALQHLQEHICGYPKGAKIQNIAARFVTELNQNPVAFVLESWINTNLKHRLDWKSKGVEACELRNRMLHAASRNGSPNAVGVLLAAGVDSSVVDTCGRTILRRAIDQGQEAVAMVILLYGKGDINEKDESGGTLLHSAVQRGNIAMVKLLVDGKANVDMIDEDKRTPLHWAVRLGNMAIAMVLALDGKADVNVQDNFEQTALHCAATQGHDALARFLVAQGRANVNVQDKHKRTALHWAATQGHDALARFLVVQGRADVNVQDSFDRTALHWVAKEGNDAIAKLLVVEGKTKVDTKDDKNQTPLHLAAERGHEAVVRLLLREGKANINAKCKYWLTALHLIAKIDPERSMKQHEDTAKLLIVEGKADVNAKDRGGWTPLHWAARFGHETIVRLLLGEEEIDIHAKSNGGRTALHWAIDQGNKAIARLLMEHQAREGPQDSPEE